MRDVKPIIPLNLLENKITMTEMKKKPDLGCDNDYVGRDSCYSDDTVGSGKMYHVLGLFIVAGLPTAFWLGCFLLVGSYFEIHLDLLMFCLVGLCMFLFLWMVYGMFSSGKQG